MEQLTFKPVKDTSPPDNHGAVVSTEIHIVFWKEDMGTGGSNLLPYFQVEVPVWVSVDPGSGVSSTKVPNPSLILGIGQGQQCYQQAGLDQVPYYSWSTEAPSSKLSPSPLGCLGWGQQCHPRRCGSLWNISRLMGEICFLTLLWDPPNAQKSFGTQASEIALGSVISPSSRRVARWMDCTCWLV